MTVAIRLPRIGTFSAWRSAARRLAGARVEPDAVDWGLCGDPSLFQTNIPHGTRPLSVPRAFLGLAAGLIPERSGKGMAMAYRLLCRLQETPLLLGNRADRDVARARQTAKSVRRDIHKMKAFVRFRELPNADGRRRFAAWFEPSHRIEEPVARFFTDRFGDMDWLIQTPEVSVLFEDGALRLVAEANRRPDIGDDIEQLWTTYYAHIFNPARLKVKAMQAEMPKKYWRNLPETAIIRDLVTAASHRTGRMRQAEPSEPPGRAGRISARRRAGKTGR